ncbi:hypothetical protein M8J75_016364 [Diaphorina citri]|nr:hypothetical protein M8J75_016364 [Diaphorina citri]
MRCKGCKLDLPTDGDYVVCSKCKGQYHFKCNSLSESSWKSMSLPKKSVWKCVACRDPPTSTILARSGSNSSIEADNTTPKGVTDSIILTTLEAFERRLTKLFTEKMSDFEKSLEFNSKTVEEMSATMKNIEQKVILVEKKQEALQAENVELKTKVRGLETIVQELVQKEGLNKIEISGIPASVKSDGLTLAREFIRKPLLFFFLFFFIILSLILLAALILYLFFSFVPSHSVPSLSFHSSDVNLPNMIPKLCLLQGSDLVRKYA